MMTKANTTVPTLNLFGKNVDVPYRVTLLDYTYTEEEAKQLGRGYDNFETTRPYNSKYKDLMGVVVNGELKLSSISQPVIGSFDVTTDRGRKDAEAAIKTWHDSVMGRGDYQFLAGKSKIKGDLSSEVSRPAETSDSSSDDDTVKPLSWLSGAKAPKVATTFMGQTLIAGSTKDVVEFKGNSAYNISVTYDSETGYTVKAPIRGITENGKVFKNAKDAQRAIAKYETAIKKHLEKTKKPEQNANPYAKALKTPNLLNVFDPNFKINGLEEYKIPATDFTGPLFQTE
jgi:hypothetical protein